MLRTFVTVLALALLAAAGAFAEAGACGQQFEDVAGGLPDSNAGPDAPEQMNVPEKHTEGALAALDAARIASETEFRVTLASGAEATPTSDGWDPARG